jgi:hypothetical protein
MFVIKRNNLPSIRPSTWKMSSVLRNETPTVFRKRSFSTGKKKKLCWCPNLKKWRKMERSALVVEDDLSPSDRSPGTNGPYTAWVPAIILRSRWEIVFYDVQWPILIIVMSGYGRRRTEITAESRKARRRFPVRVLPLSSPFGIIRLRFDTEKFWYRIPLLTVYFTRFYT